MHKISHLNTGTMCPHGARLVNGRGSLFGRARLVCHVLLLESEDGLVLVDTGLGSADVTDPLRLGRRWLRRTAPQLDMNETAVAQVRKMGYAVDDVRHIVVTHLDVDHAGGLPDFPQAKVHVHAREHAAAMAAAAQYGQAGRYRAAHWQHGPHWVLADDGGDRWYGFEGVRAISERHPDILMIPLPGHTPGHCGVAVRSGKGWQLHAGDSYFFHGQIADPPRPAPLALGWVQRRGDSNYAQRLENEGRLRELKARHGDEVRIFNGHDPLEFDQWSEAEQA